MAKSIEQLRGEIRYAERLCERTARMYRHVQTLGTFLTIVGGSGVVSVLASQAPAWMPIAGAVVLTMAAAALIAIRPADKAAQNEADTKRYAALLNRSNGLNEAQLSQALDEARQADTAEVESLRDVAWNDVVEEIGRSETKVPLTLPQRLLAAIA